MKSSKHNDTDLYFIGFSYLPASQSHLPSNTESKPELRTPIPEITVPAVMSSVNPRVYELQNILNTKIRELDVSMDEKGLMQKEKLLMEDKVMYLFISYNRILY